MPLLQLLGKALLPSFLPLIVFVAADAVFGEFVGLLVGLGVGLVELVGAAIREKRLDPFILADTLLLGAAGGLSLALRDDLFLKLKPAVVELVFGLGFGLLLLLPGEVLLDYFRRQLRGIELPAASLPALRKSVAGILGLLGLHAGLTVWAALALSTAAWGFVSGGLLYLLFGIYAGILWLRAWRVRRASGHSRAGGKAAAPGEELLPLVDEEGKILGSATRSACHEGPGKLHPVVRLHVADAAGRFYLQRRSERKETAPGLWDCAAAGHVAYGEDLRTALLREFREELGVAPFALTAARAEPAGVLRYRYEGEESELVFVFALRYDGPFSPDGIEVAEGRFWTAAEIDAALGSGLFAPAFLREWPAFRASPLAAPAK